MTTNLKEYKELKKLQLLLKEVGEAVKVLNVTTKTLKKYQKYKAIKELGQHLNECESTMERFLLRLQLTVENYGKLESFKK